MSEFKERLSAVRESAKDSLRTPEERLVAAAYTAGANNERQEVITAIDAMIMDRKTKAREMLVLEVLKQTIERGEYRRTP